MITRVYDLGRGQRDAKRLMARLFRVSLSLSLSLSFFSPDETAIVLSQHCAIKSINDDLTAGGLSTDRNRALIYLFIPTTDGTNALAQYHCDILQRGALWPTVFRHFAEYRAQILFQLFFLPFLFCRTTRTRAQLSYKLNVNSKTEKKKKN